MTGRRLLSWMTACALGAVLVTPLLGRHPAGANCPIVKVDRAITYQTMTGWEATARAGEPDPDEVVVVSVAAGGPVVIDGLPAGTYGVTYATETGGGEGTDLTIDTGKHRPTTILQPGVVTILAKSGNSAVVPPAPAGCP
jgi:hypothetical protein